MQMFEPADNIDLLAVVQEWEEYYEMRFARKPKLARSHVDTHQPDWPVRQRRRSGRVAEAGRGARQPERCEEPREAGRYLGSSSGGGSGGGEASREASGRSE